MHVEAHAELSSETKDLSTNIKPHALVRYQHPFHTLSTLNTVAFPYQTHIGVEKGNTFGDSVSS